VTEVKSYAFPSGFTFEEYALKGPSQYDLWARKHAEAVVTTIRTECSRTNLLPSPSQYGRTVVNDFRLRPTQPSGPMFTYVNRDRWLTPAEGKALSEGKPWPEASSLSDRNRKLLGFIKSFGKKQGTERPELSG